MELDLSAYSGVIFDMDGTLIDTMPAHLEAWASVAAHYDFPFERDWLHSLGGKPSFNIIQEVNRRYDLALDPLKASQYKMAAFQALKEQGEVIEHTLQVLKAVHGVKKTAIGTGSARANALKLLTERSLTQLFDTIVTSTEVENYKPLPDTFLLAAQNIGVSASNCVVFEDTELGKMAAHAAGMDCYMVTADGFVFYPVQNKVIG